MKSLPTIDGSVSTRRSSWRFPSTVFVAVLTNLAVASSALDESTMAPSSTAVPQSPAEEVAQAKRSASDLSLENGGTRSLFWFGRAVSAPAEFASLTSESTTADALSTAQSTTNGTAPPSPEKQNRHKLLRLVDALSSFDNVSFRNSNRTPTPLAPAATASLSSSIHDDKATPNRQVSASPTRRRRPRWNHNKRGSTQQSQQSASPAQTSTAAKSSLLHGTLDPDGAVEVIFYDAAEYGDKQDDVDDFCDDYSRDSVVLPTICISTEMRGGDSFTGSGGNYDPYHHESIELSRRSFGSHDNYYQDESTNRQYDDSVNGGLQQDLPTPSSAHSVGGAASGHAHFHENGNGHAQQQHTQPPLPPPPPPPVELPLRFLLAGKGDPQEGLQRYQETLAWRRSQNVDTILRQPNPQFDLIKQHYPHFCYGKGKQGEPCFYEQPPKTDLKALRRGGVTIESLLRHYTMVTEFQWQFLERDDLQKSVYIIDLQGIRFGDFVGEVVDFVKQASKLSAQHYPERAGYVFVINVPSWFKLIWAVVRPLVDEATLEKIYILRGAEEIKRNLQERIDIENIPAEYGGLGPPLAESHEEHLLADLVRHNNAMAENGGVCPHVQQGGVEAANGNGQAGSGCPFCTWRQPRSY